MTDRQQTNQTAMLVIERVVRVVATERGLAWARVLSPRREAPPYAAARVLSMAVACSAGLPMSVVARAFGRTWQTVDSARIRQTGLALADPVLRDEFIRTLYKALGGDTAAPAEDSEAFQPDTPAAPTPTHRH